VTIVDGASLQRNDALAKNRSYDLLKPPASAALEIRATPFLDREDVVYFAPAIATGPVEIAVQ